MVQEIIELSGQDIRLQIGSIYPAIYMTPAAGWQSLDGYKEDSAKA